MTNEPITSLCCGINALINSVQDLYKHAAFILPPRCQNLVGDFIVCFDIFTFEFQFGLFACLKKCLQREL